jgi:nicotinamide-nucleotide amidase
MEGPLDKELFDLSTRIGQALSARGWVIATAESCTGGWVAECITMVSGSSQWFDRGYVTYTNLAKQEVLGVSSLTLAAHGAVSEPAVREMVTGALGNSHAKVALAISGVAGPTGGTAEKPVGTVCIAWGVRDGALDARTFHFDGDRETVRRQSVIEALRAVLVMTGDASALRSST